MRLAAANSCVIAKEHEWKWKLRAGSHHILGPSHSLICITSTGNKYSNSTHIRDASCQVKTITRNSKMAALIGIRCLRAIYEFSEVCLHLHLQLNIRLHPHPSANAQNLADVSAWTGSSDGSASTHLWHLQSKLVNVVMIWCSELNTGYVSKYICIYVAPQLCKNCGVIELVFGK